MLDRLTCAIAAVIDYPEAVLQPLLGGYLGGDLKDMRHYGAVALVYLRRGGDMLLGYDENMNGSLGVEIVESHDGIVLIDLGGGYLTRRYFAKMQSIFILLCENAYFNISFTMSATASIAALTPETSLVPAIAPSGLPPPEPPARPATFLAILPA